MRVAFTGAHFTGKSSLIAALARWLPGYQIMPEPYYQLAEEGYHFAALPVPEDFEAQLARAIENLETSEARTLFDRCPLDFLAYLAAHAESPTVDRDEHFEACRQALKKLDLLVYLPIEEPDLITLPASQDEDFRQRADEALRELLLDAADEWGVPVLEIQGDVFRRVARVLAHLTGPQS